MLLFTIWENGKMGNKKEAYASLYYERLERRAFGFSSDSVSSSAS